MYVKHQDVASDTQTLVLCVNTSKLFTVLISMQIRSTRETIIRAAITTTMIKIR